MRHGKFRDVPFYDVIEMCLFFFLTIMIICELIID